MRSMIEGIVSAHKNSIVGQNETLVFFMECKQRSLLNML
jgi:hypothetical protein